MSEEKRLVPGSVVSIVFSSTDPGIRDLKITELSQGWIHGNFQIPGSQGKKPKTAYVVIPWSSVQYLEIK